MLKKIDEIPPGYAGTGESLSRYDPRETSAFKGDKEKALGELARLNKRLENLKQFSTPSTSTKCLSFCRPWTRAGKEGTFRSA